MFDHSNLLLNRRELKNKIVTPINNKITALNHKSEIPNPFNITPLIISLKYLKGTI